LGGDQVSPDRFEEIRFKEGEGVDDFSMRITGLANSIAVLGGRITEAEIVKKMLHVAPAPLEQVAKRSSTEGEKEGRLLLTEEEWLARLKIHDSTKGGGSRNSGGSGSGDGVKKTGKPPKLGLDGKTAGASPRRRRPMRPKPRRRKAPCSW
jgi:hypothetical protein